MILDFSEPADDTHQNIARSCGELFTKRLPAFTPAGKHTEVESQWYDSESLCAANSEFFVDLPPLLLTDDDDAICNQ